MDRIRHTFFGAALAWALLALGLAAAGGQIALQLSGCGYGTEPSPPGLYVAIVPAGVAFAVIGRLLTARRPENRIGWLLAWVGFGLPAAILSQLFTDCVVTGALALPGAPLVALLNPHLALASIIALFVVLPACFPDGRFQSDRWAVLLLAIAAAAMLISLGAGLVPGQINSGVVGQTAIENPLGVRWDFLEQIAPVLVAGPPIVVSVAILLAIISFVLRFWRSTGEARQQFKWFAAFLSTVVVVHIIGFEIGGTLFYPQIFRHWSYSAILALSFGGFPVVIGLAIFKYRLYDVDLIIRRTLTYGALTALLALAYFGTVIVMQGVVGTFTGGARSPLVTVISTLGIAALFNPLRHRVQDFIDRRFYRAKYDAAQTLARFASTARDEVDVDQLTRTLVGVVKETMQPAHVSLWLKTRSRGPAGEAHAK
jgi:hypothetical protein